ncbi:MAG TPA: tetratricopeptide repeat protein [Candidatus Polarisedimenticolia bacterium]|nr:tetratricopeptide repeat protein [Candidatus Polarisedimenticolia bacterium]
MTATRQGAVVALVGCLVAFTACGGTVDHLKANYATRTGNDFYKAQNYDKAIEWYRYGTYLNPDLAIAYYHTALSYMALYKPGSHHPKDIRYGQEAVDNLETYLRYYPDHDEAKGYLLNILLQAERYDDAGKFFEQELKRKETDPRAASQLMLTLGVIYAKKGDFDTSLEWYKKRAELEKDSPEALYTIGQLCWEKVYKAGQTLDMERRKQLIEMGLEYLKRASDLKENYFEAVLYINLLYREKAKVAQLTGNMEEVQKWMQEAETNQKVALEMRKKAMDKK